MREAQTSEHTFEIAAAFAYRCSVRRTMTGYVTVTGVRAAYERLGKPPTAADTYSGASRIDVPRGSGRQAYPFVVSHR